MIRDAQGHDLTGATREAADSLDQGVAKKWNEGKASFTHKITVPFPWGSELSGVPDKSDIAWYQREINVNRNLDQNPGYGN